MKLSKQSDLLLLALISGALVLHATAKPKTLCETNTASAAIANHPLFDTPYKAAANYSPVLALRALGSTEIYRKKGNAHLIRKFYVGNLQGKLGEPFETMVLDLEVSAKGLFGRVAKGFGHINDLDLYYENEASFGLPKRAYMNAYASLDGCELMKLKTDSDGDKLINKVSGNYLSRVIDYQTQWRSSSGLLAGYQYQINVEGSGGTTVPCDKSNQHTVFCQEHGKSKSPYQGKSSGTIAGYKISGWIRETSPDYFEGEEYYGPIVIKTVLDITVNK